MNSEISKNITKLKTSSSWNGVVVNKWADIVFEPEELLKNPNKIFKSEKSNSTILKNIQAAKGEVSIVVKKTAELKGIKRIVDFVRGSKALRNFKFALVLKQKGIETAEPIAALWNHWQCNIYVTEFVAGSENLYDIAFGRNAEINNNFSTRKDVINEIANLIANLHKAGFWHRDSKAGNFIVYKNGGKYKAKFVDLDGIKKNFISYNEKQIRTLANLAKTLTRFKRVNLTDLYRGFKIYCQTMGIGSEEIRPLFGKVERETVRLRLLTVLEEANKLKGVSKKHKN